MANILVTRVANRWRDFRHRVVARLSKERIRHRAHVTHKVRTSPDVRSYQCVRDVPKFRNPKIKTKTKKGKIKMIIRTIDNVFVNLDSVAKIRFNPENSEIEIVYPFKMEGYDYYYDVDCPLADMGANPEDIVKIMEMFIIALKRNEPYFDFREAYLEALQNLGLGDATEVISRLYDGKRD